MSSKKIDKKIDKIIKDILKELDYAERNFGPYNSSHEGFAVIQEEFDELWDVVKLNPKKIPVEELGEIFSTKPGEEHLLIKRMQIAERQKRLRAEAIQVATTAIRFIKDICDKE